MEIPEPKLSRVLFADTRSAWVWLIVRLYVGYAWWQAGWAKLGVAAWTGDQAGSALRGFVSHALEKVAGAHPDVQGWYAAFLKAFVLQHTAFFSYLVVYGELAVGLGLILGAFTGIAAFFGSFMNLNYLLAGTVSSNPVLLSLGLFLILAWRIAGWYGVDHYLLPKLGVPWQPGTLFSSQR